MPCNCNAMSDPNPSNNEFAKITINNQTDVDLYLNLSEGQKGPPNNVIPKNSAVSWISGADNDITQLFWNDRGNPSGATGELSITSSSGVTLIPGGGSWVSVDGMIETGMLPNDTVNIQGPGTQKPWNSSGRGLSYDIYLHFMGTAPPPPPPPPPPKTYACNLTVVNNATGNLIVNSKDTLTKGQSKLYNLTAEENCGLTFLGGTKGDAVGSVVLGPSSGLTVNRGDMAVANAFIMTVNACSESPSATATYTQSTNLGPNGYQIFKSDQFALGGSVTVTYSDPKPISSKSEMC